MQATSTVKNLRMSPRKLRLFAKEYIGMFANEAVNRMKLTVNFASKPIFKAINSALANGANNLRMEANKMVIKNIIVNEGSALKRMAKGRKATTDRGLVKRKFSHLKILLEEKGAQNG